MIEISYTAGNIAVTLAWILFRAMVYYKKRSVDWKYEARQLWMYICILVLVRFTFFPFSKVDGKVQPLIFDAATMFPLRVNLVPFVHMLDYEGSTRDMLINVIGNTAMFIPVTILLPLVYPQLNSFGKVMAAGVGISLAIEFLQLPFTVRATDIDDLILNSLGCLLGYGILALVRKAKRKH